MPRGVYIHKKGTGGRKGRSGVYKHAKGYKKQPFSEEHRRHLREALSGTKRPWGAEARWKDHVAKPRKSFKGLWKGTHDPVLQQSKKRFRNMRYKVRKRDSEGIHTYGEWELLKRQYGYVCPCCGKSEQEVKLTEDHIIPLSKGGSDFIENIQPLCLSCNVRKHTKSTKFKSKGGEIAIS
mgnify:CR=1 FL=1